MRKFDRGAEDCEIRSGCLCLSAVGAVLFAAGAAIGWWLCRDHEARPRADLLEESELIGRLRTGDDDA